METLNNIFTWKVPLNAALYNPVIRLWVNCGFIFFLLHLIFLPSLLNAQRDLKLVSDEATELLSGLTGTAANKIERATLTKEDERSVTVSLRFVGFADKEYKLQVAILNRSKEVIADITPVEIDMPKSKQADVSMNMVGTGKPMSQPSLESKFIRVRVSPKEGGITGVLGDTFDDLNLNASEFLFELDRKWMLMGSAIKVNVVLTPFKGAATIPQ